jgi:predicted transposase/invertase (TIGR01784 family)
VAGQYDDNVKKLIETNPQDFVALAVNGGHFEEILDKELKSVHIFADALLKITQNGKPMLAHFEFQSGNDPHMQERLLEYNTLASREYDYLPVSSCVIYLKKVNNPPTSPFIRQLPDSEEVVRFHYKLIELAELSADEFLESGGVGLSPLVTLTQDGTKHDVVRKMITGLQSSGQANLLVIAGAIASLAFEDKSVAEQEWLERTFAMLNDTLRNTKYYQKILKEGLEEGLEKGLEKGLEEGLEEGLEKGRREERQRELQLQREALVDIVLDRFPQMVRLFKKQADTIEDPSLLLRLIVKISTAQSTEEAEQHLLTILRAASGDEDEQA